jgi:hypothetical protein
VKSASTYALMAGAVAAALAGTTSGEPVRRQRVQTQPEPIYRHPKSPRLNRSNKWPHAKTYAEARAMSPFPERPVR